MLAVVNTQSYVTHPLEDALEQVASWEVTCLEFGSSRSSSLFRITGRVLFSTMETDTEGFKKEESATYRSPNFINSTSKHKRTLLVQDFPQQNPTKAVFTLALTLHGKTQPPNSLK